MLNFDLYLTFLSLSLSSSLQQIFRKNYFKQNVLHIKAVVVVVWLAHSPYYRSALYDHEAIL